MLAVAFILVYLRFHRNPKSTQKNGILLVVVSNTKKIRFQLKTRAIVHSHFSSFSDCCNNLYFHCRIFFQTAPHACQKQKKDPFSKKDTCYSAFLFLLSLGLLQYNILYLHCRIFSQTALHDELIPLLDLNRERLLSPRIIDSRLVEILVSFQTFRRLC